MFISNFLLSSSTIRSKFVIYTYTSMFNFDRYVIMLSNYPSSIHNYSYNWLLSNKSIFLILYLYIHSHSFGPFVVGQYTYLFTLIIVLTFVWSVITDLISSSHLLDYILYIYHIIFSSCIVIATKLLFHSHIYTLNSKVNVILRFL